ncbi:endonuclease III [Myxococcota bacterium]|jgi:endonuclease-3|nr:endonuclease III [Myxococcota bacterium]
MEDRKDLRTRAAEVDRILEEWYPESTRTPLRWKTPLDLLVATILAAQAKDETVNQVMPVLTARYPDAAALSRAPLGEIEAVIHSTGFYRNKARLVQACCQAIVDRHGGRVPDTMEDLVALPGVGRKTANVVLGNCFGLPAMVVDTHVLRVADRLGLARGRDADQVEAILCSLLPPGRWTAFCHRVTWFGRERCVARRPRCEECRLASLCPFLQADRQGT